MTNFYLKQPLSIADQVNLLRNRGLQFLDENRAEIFLNEVSFFRFAQYLRPMESDKVLHSFKPNTIICCIAHWLDSLGRVDSIKAKLKALIAKFPSVDICAMGFPGNWLVQPLWM